MAEASHAVFLSYASQDAEAAQKIAGALRAGGIEVFLDQSELRGGDAWDKKIRHEIHDCVLFIPIVSQHTQERLEGYFRHEWNLAIERTHHMAENKAFLVPVVVDGTPQHDPSIPEKFRELQWTCLPAGETPPQFVTRIQKLLSGESGPVPTMARRPAVVASKRSSRLVPAVLAVVVAGVAAYLLIEKPWAARSVAFAPAPHSIAVLPFVDMSEKHDQEYFADGLAEELLDLLAKTPGLKVIARTSAFSFKGKLDDIPTIAGKLKVAHVLEGSVRRSTNRLRVTTQLVADTGEHIWSETYDRELTDVFQMQDEIARAVAYALKVKIGPGPGAAGAHRAVKLEAYDAYLRGNQYRDIDTPEANQRARESYRQAVELDPSFAAAYGGLADSEWRVLDQFGPQAASYERALAAADTAIRLAPEEPDGYWARGHMRYSYRFDWTGAKADLAKALALDPNDPRGRTTYGELLAGLGELDAGIKELHEATVVDPLSPKAWRSLAWVLNGASRYDDALQAANRVSNLVGQPDVMLGDCELLGGHPAVALGIYRKLIDEYDSPRGIALAEHSLGHERESQRALVELIREGTATYAYQVGEIYAWRGERDRAFEWLDRAFRQHDGGLTRVSYDPFLRDIRSDPRYQAFLRKMKLPE